MATVTAPLAHHFIAGHQQRDEEKEAEEEAGGGGVVEHECSRHTYCVVERASGGGPLNPKDRSGIGRR